MRKLIHPTIRFLYLSNKVILGACQIVWFGYVVVWRSMVTALSLAMLRYQSTLRALVHVLQTQKCTQHSAILALLK